MRTRGLRPKCICSTLGTSAFYNRAKAEPQTEPGIRQLEAEPGPWSAARLETSLPMAPHHAHTQALTQT